MTANGAPCAARSQAGIVVVLERSGFGFFSCAFMFFVDDRVCCWSCPFLCVFMPFVDKIALTASEACLRFRCWKAAVSWC